MARLFFYSAYVPETEISIVVPVFNSAAHLDSLIRSFQAIEGLSLQIILVDDGSSDNSAEIIAAAAARDGRIEPVYLSDNSGAGVARNIGFKRAKGTFTLFFDADDILHVEPLKAMLQRAKLTNAQVVLAQYDLASSREAKPEPMHRGDSMIWKRLASAFPQKVFSIDRDDEVLNLVNFPWNKIVRTDFARAVGMRFGSTRVNNDVLGHWTALLRAERIAFVEQVLCTHIVPDKGANITRIDDRRRLAMFQVFDEVEAVFAADPELRRKHRWQFVSFAAALMVWGANVIDEAHLDEYVLRAGDWLGTLDVHDFLAMTTNRNNRLATRYARAFRHGAMPIK